MYRRLFLQQSLATSILARDWKSSPPRAYLTELATLMRAAPVPGAVIGVIRRFELSWIAPLGVRAAGSTDPVTSSTLFQAASLTKQVTTFAVFALRAQGKLDLDRPLVSYLDDLSNPAARTVTARHILSHSSGFPNWRFAAAGQPAPNLVPAFTPGSRYQYSGEGFFYLQRVLERITGIGFGQLVRDLVFQPLGMSSSTLAWDPETEARTAVPHDRQGKSAKAGIRAPRSPDVGRARWKTGQ